MFEQPKGHRIIFVKKQTNKKTTHTHTKQFLGCQVTLGKVFRPPQT